MRSDGFFESLIDMTAGLSVRADAFEPLFNVQVGRINALSLHMGV